jgi:2-polyprenyl-3-methyl-5-hydroxy-6-metoxy-1,4-benzoquinol methylase
MTDESLAHRLQDFNPSFRDPAGTLVLHDSRIFRIISKLAMQDLTSFLTSKQGRKLLSSGNLVRTRFLSDSEKAEILQDLEVRRQARGFDVGGIAEHERVPFPSYPYEWPPEMLQAAGHLTLDLATGLLPESLGVKDATPYNILFRGSSPVFVDLLSVERREPRDPIWLAHAQFVRTFLLPLLVNKEFAVPLEQSLLSRRDGLEPEVVYHLCSALQKLRPPFLTLVSIPSWLGARHKAEDQSIYRPHLVQNPEKARYILESLLNRLRRLLNRLTPANNRESHWADYMKSQRHYAPEELMAKQAFVEKALKECKPTNVLDIGCNTGYFSALAARQGASVVAIDSDPVVVGQVWRMATREKLDILALVINLARPSPSVGWRNGECRSFLDRASGHFDAVFMLALIHHLLVSERIPLAEIMEVAAMLTSKLLVIEYVGPEDAMFRCLTRGRDSLFQGLNRQVFEAALVTRFECLESRRLGQSHRWIYLLRKRASNDTA